MSNSVLLYHYDSAEKMPHYNFNIRLPIHLEKIKDKVGNKIHEDIVSTIIKLGDQMNMETNVKANKKACFI